MSLIASFLLLGQGQLTLKPGLPAGATIRYVVTAKEINYEGASAKVTKTYETKTPVVLKVTAPNSASLSVGPLQVAGKSVGRAKVKEITFDKQFSNKGLGLSPFAVVLPAGGVKPGQTWKGPLASMAPLPAGMTATYKFAKVATILGKLYAQVSVSIAASGSSTVKGSGSLFIAISTGYLSHGNLKFEVSFVRPDPKDAKKMLVNSHQTFAYKITAS